MTEAAHDIHDAAHDHGEGAPPPSWHHAWTRPGWYRTLWLMPLFGLLGTGLVVLIRWAAGWQPYWQGQAIVTVALVTVPMGFLAGLGGFDFWVRYSAGRPTEAEDH